MSIRDKFRPVDMSKVKSILEDQDQYLEKSNRNYLEIEDGKNIIRIMPVLGNDEFWMIHRRRHWVPVEQPDGTKKNLPVPNARVMGKLPNDPVEAYMAIVQRQLGTSKKPNDMQVITAMTSYKSREKLLPDDKWILYAAKIVKSANPLDGGKKENWQLGILEINDTLYKVLRKEMESEDTDEAIETDPFSDIDNGYALIVHYAEKEQAYVKRYTGTKRSTQRYPVPDEILERYSVMDPLSKAVGGYTRRDFQRAVEGIRQWDELYELEIYASEEYQDVIHKIQALLPDEEEQVDIDQMDRAALKDLIKKKGLEVTVSRSKLDHELRTEIKTALGVAVATHEEAKDELPDIKDDDELDFPTPSKPSVKASVADFKEMRDRLTNGKKASVAHQEEED